MVLGSVEEKLSIQGFPISLIQIPGSSFMGFRILFYGYCIPHLQILKQKIKVNLKMKPGYADARVNLKQGINYKLILNSQPTWW